MQAHSVTEVFTSLLTSLLVLKQLHGMHGEKVVTRELTGERNYDLSISEFPVGLCFVKVAAGEEAQIFKLIKTN